MTAESDSRLQLLLRIAGIAFTAWAAFVPIGAAWVANAVKDGVAEMRSLRTEIVELRAAIATLKMETTQEVTVIRERQNNVIERLRDLEYEHRRVFPKEDRDEKK